VATPDDQEEWITIDEAKRLTGKSRATLMRMSKDKRAATRVEEQPFTQTQKRLLFRKSDILPDREAV
jgi:hypothetical protein